MTVANTESHNLTIDGTGSGVGSGGWSGDWKYHYQSEDLVDDTDTKKFAWTDGKWSQTDHTFRTDHKGSSSWWFDMGRTYNQVYDPELGSWRTEIENQKMGGSSSYHEVKWGGANNYQFSDKRGGSSFKNGSGSGSYGFNLSGSGGSSSFASAETASYRDNRAGTVVNGVTTYSSVDIHSLSEKTSWSESQNQTLQVATWTRNDDWSRDEITITGDSNSLTTTKNNAFTKVFAYANGTGSGAPGTGGYSLGDNQSSTGTTTGAANGPILGGNYNNTLPGTPGSFSETSGYFGGSIIVNGRQTPGGFWGEGGEDEEGDPELGGTQFISDIIVPIKGNNQENQGGGISNIDPRPFFAVMDPRSPFSCNYDPRRDEFFRNPYPPHIPYITNRINAMIGLTSGAAEASLGFALCHPVIATFTGGWSALPAFLFISHAGSVIENQWNQLWTGECTPNGIERLFGREVDGGITIVSDSINLARGSIVIGKLAKNTWEYWDEIDHLRKLAKNSPNKFDHLKDLIEKNPKSAANTQFEHLKDLIEKPSFVAPNSELHAARQRIAGQIEEVGRRRSLGTDPTGQWRAAEEGAALRLEQQVGQLRRDPSKVGDWIDKSGKVVYDAVGPVPSKHFDLGSFTRQIDKHLLKQGVDKIVVDLTGLSETVRAEVLKYISGLSDALRARIIIQF